MPPPAFPIHGRLAWLVCASIAVLSARHLLVERNLHYPLQLYFAQLAVSALFALRPFWSRKDAQPSFRERPEARASATRGVVLLVTAMGLGSVATICALQAILHVTNLPTLILMTVRIWVALVWSSHTNLLQMIVFFAESLILVIARTVPPTQAEFARISLLLVAGVGLLFTEYRLNVPGLVSSILAMLMTGVARALRQIVAKHHPDVMASNMNSNSRSVAVAAVVGVVWVLVFRQGPQTFAFDLGTVPLLAVHAVFSALALALGKSILLPIDETVSESIFLAGSARGRHTCDALTVAAFAAIVGCHSALSIRRSYTNTYQYCCFLLAMLCISSRDLIDSSQRSRFGNSAYELVDGSRPSMQDRDSLGFAKETKLSSLRALLLKIQANKLVRRYSLGVSIALLWTAYVGFNYTDRPKSSNPTILDREYEPTVPVEIVLSMYKEPVEEVRELLSNLKKMPPLRAAESTIYIKDSTADNEAIKQQTGATHIITLPNVGREGETFLNHIVRRWDTLARQTVFLQADIHNPREFYPHLRNYYSRAKTGYLSLGWSGAMCNCDTCADRLFWTDNTHFFPQLHSRIANSSTSPSTSSTSTPQACPPLLLSYKGQFVVSAARIRGIGKAIYNDLLTAFVDEKSWAHQQEYLQGRPDSMNAPDFGYTMERAWNVLFQCAGAEVGWKCPSLISGWRVGGEIADCQCFDE
jgi:hypothetical protein